MINQSPIRRFFQGDELDVFVRELERECGGTLHFAVKDLQNGDMAVWNSSHKCKTASVIKLPILAHVAYCVREGSLTWEEPLTLTDAEKVDGSGVLTQLTAGLQLSLRDVCALMTIVSDNTATNMVIEHVGVDAINARMRSFNLPITTCFRKAYSPDTEASKEYGLGVTTPEEMLRLLVRLADNESGDESTNKDILNILAGQFYRDAIPRLLPADWKYMGKTGAIDAVRNDVGLVESGDGNRYALALFCQNLPVVQWTADNPGLLALAKLTHRLLIEE